MALVPFVKGAKNILEESSSKIPLYLLSVTPIQDLTIIVDRLEIRSYFKDIYGCPPWNKPDAIRDILQKENCSAKKAVMIGDSYGDQRAAAETGIHFIGRDSGLGFEYPQPEIIIPDLYNLTEVLKLIK
jgi:phosphoglycolate phosphatase-like HAD superfamily hydrolase